MFLLVEQPRQRLSHWSQALAALDDAAAPPLAGVDAYYDAASNQAIFGLRYNEHTLGPDRLSYVVEVALLAEIGLIQPAELSEGDRRRFVSDRLAACTVTVVNQRKAVDALVELVRRVRAQKGGTSPPALEATLLPRAKPAVAPKVRARVETGESAVVVAAKGTRDAAGGDPAGEARRPRATGDLALGSVRQHKSQLAGLDRDEGPRSAGTAPALAMGTEAPELHDAPPRTRPATVPPGREGGPRPSPNVIVRGGLHRAATVMMSTVEARRMLEAAAQPAEATGTDEPPAPPTPEPVTEPRDATRTISARYLRSGRWVPLRIGSLSLKGAALMAVALPRVDDRVDVALAYAQHRALVRGAVQKVSTMKEAETSGATMFSVNFELDDGSRRQLTALLTAARAANVTIKPAPPRGTRRYPVEWPVCLGTSRGAVRAEALDVSSDGMFVKPIHPLSLDAHVTFSAVLDDSQPPVSGHARVVRNITAADADALDAGLSPGYGLIILEMADPERERWSRFLRRVAKRSSKRVLIAASSARLAELETGLVAGGYATAGGTEPGAIAQLVSAEARPYDAALLDATWLLSEGSTLWVESVFTARNIPYVTVHGDAKRGRQAVDRLLAVV
ncbi:MAG TPA: hypothetical protein VHW23_06675 [Kofleriaceae bacterium]|nr:hypothetical protein [Kofleriaceae bacterium]